MTDPAEMVERTKARGLRRSIARARRKHGKSAREVLSAANYEWLRTYELHHPPRRGVERLEPGEPSPTAANGSVPPRDDDDDAPAEHDGPDDDAPDDEPAKDDSEPEPNDAPDGTPIYEPEPELPPIADEAPPSLREAHARADALQHTVNAQAASLRWMERACMLFERVANRADRYLLETQAQLVDAITTLSDSAADGNSGRGGGGHRDSVMENAFEGFIMQKLGIRPGPTPGAPPRPGGAPPPKTPPVDSPPAPGQSERHGNDDNRT